MPPPAAPMSMGGGESNDSMTDTHLTVTCHRTAVVDRRPDETATTVIR
jgi:hypothetical protein